MVREDPATKRILQRFPTSMSIREEDIDIPESVVLDVPFEDAVGPVENRVGDYEGTVNGDVELADAEAKVKVSLRLASVDDAYLDFGTPSDLTETDRDMTFEAWIRPEAVDGSGAALLTSKDLGATGGGWAFYLTSGQALGMEVADGSNTESVTSSGTVSLDAWTHVVIAYDASKDEVTFYIDGSEDSTATFGTVTAPTDDTGHGVFMGQEDASSPEYGYQGRLDEALLYKAELTATQVSTRYDQTNNWDVNDNRRFQQVPGSELEDADDRIDTLYDARRLVDATGGALDRWGQEIGVPRDAGEDDAAYRIRLIARFRALRSGATSSHILTFLAGALNLDVEDLTLTRNEDPETGSYRPRFYFVEAPVSGLVSQGITEQEEFDAKFDLAESLLDEVDAAGVTGQFRLGTSFTWEGNDGYAGPSAVGSDGTGWGVDSEDTGKGFGPENEGGYWGGMT